MKYKILKTAFLAWVILWIFFTGRELFIKGCFIDYKELSHRPLDGKRSYVTGDRFYEFLTFCNKTLPQGSGYGIIGIKEGSIDIRRAVYYLYPNLNQEDPGYILVYDEPAVRVNGYDLYRKLDDTRYILKKRSKV